MNPLKALFNNDKIKDLAFSGLRKMMNEGGYVSIVLVNNPDNESGPLPGFDVHMFKESVEVFEKDTVGVSKEHFDNYNRLLEQEETMRSITIEASESKDYFEGIPDTYILALKDPEVINIIERYLKAKRQHNGSHTTENELIERDNHAGK